MSRAAKVCVKVCNSSGHGCGFPLRGAGEWGDPVRMGLMVVKWWLNGVSMLISDGLVI